MPTPTATDPQTTHPVFVSSSSKKQASKVQGSIKGLLRLPLQITNQILGIAGYTLVRKKKVILPKKGYHFVPDIYGRASHKLNDIRENQTFYRLAKTVIDQGRTLLYYDRLHTLFQGFENIIHGTDKNAPLNIAEIGVYKGGGSYFLALLANEFAPSRARVYAVDTFDGHSEVDLPTGSEGGHTFINFKDTDYPSVKRYLSEFDFVEVIQNRIQDCAAQFEDKLFHLIHLDVDIYAPTYYSLHFFGQRLHPKGMIIVDDYNFNTCPGAKEAVDQYISENPGKFIKLELLTGQCVLLHHPL